MIQITNQIPNDTITFNWQLSKFCDKFCRYCTSKDERTSLKDITRNRYTNEEILTHDKILEFLLSQTNCNINFYGGEPTLHPKFLEYYESVMNKYIDDKSVYIFLTTHGDLDTILIDNIKKLCMTKPEHIISVSYHLLQVSFETWVNKLWPLKMDCNIIISAIIPRDQQYWDMFNMNIHLLLKYGFNVELKGEFDKYLEIDESSINRFKDLIKLCEISSKLRMRPNLKQDIVFKENGKITKTIKYEDRLNLALALSPIKTLCYNRQFGINSFNQFSASCSEGTLLQITPDTDIKEIEKSLKINNCITCTRTSCSENRHDMNTTYLF